MAKKKIEVLDESAVRADGKGMTKGQRAARERKLSDMTLVALAALTEALAADCMRKVDALKQGLSATAIRRAQKRAQKMAEDFPPGHIEAMASMDLFEELCRDYDIDKSDVDKIWGAVAQVCMFQLAARRGPFARAAEDFRLTRTTETVPAAINALRSAGRDDNAICDCPNCRPRKDSELN